MDGRAVREYASQRDHGGQSRTVVRNAGSFECSVGPNRDFLLGLGRQYGIHVRADCDKGQLLIELDRQDHVAGIIDRGPMTQFAKERA